MWPRIAKSYFTFFIYFVSTNVGLSISSRLYFLQLWLSFVRKRNFSTLKTGLRICITSVWAKLKKLIRGLSMQSPLQPFRLTNMTLYKGDLCELLFHSTLKQKGKLNFLLINHKEFQLEGKPVPFDFCGHIYILKLNFPLLVIFLLCLY